MEIIAKYRIPVYKKVEPVLYKKYSAFVRQRKNGRREYTLTVDICDSDGLKVIKYLSEQYGFISIRKAS